MSWTDERIERLKKMWARRRDREPDRRRAWRSQPQRGDRQGAPPRPRAAPLPGEAGRGKGSEEAAAAAPAAAARNPLPEGRGARSRRRCACAATAAAAPAVGPAALQPGDAVSLDRPRRLHPPGSRRSAGADPAGPAAPPGAGQAEPRGRRQDRACSISTTASANGRWAIPASPTSISAASRPTPASLIASSIAASPIRRSFRAATAVRRRRSRSAAPGPLS